MLNPNEPAFPALYGQTNGADGLTKREYFAGHVMSSAISCSDCQDLTLESIAKWSVECADALIAELNKEQSN